MMTTPEPSVLEPPPLLEPPAPEPVFAVPLPPVPPAVKLPLPALAQPPGRRRRPIGTCYHHRRKHR